MYQPPVFLHNVRNGLGHQDKQLVDLAWLQMVLIVAVNQPRALVQARAFPSWGKGSSQPLLWKIPLTLSIL